jgi:regulatory protein
MRRGAFIIRLDYGTNMAMSHDRGRRVKPPLDPAALEQTALFYAGRYATTRARLAAYLGRKVRERGWTEPAPPPIEALVERMAALGYVDDRAFANARAGALTRRGYGVRRVGAALRAAGIGEEDSAEAREAAAEAAWEAAMRFAERRKIGPFSTAETDRPAREKAYAAMLRAGHAPGLARRIVTAGPGEIPQADMG